MTKAFSVGCDQGSEIYSYVAGEPFGPFINKRTVWKVNDTASITTAIGWEPVPATVLTPITTGQGRYGFLIH